MNSGAKLKLCVFTGKSELPFPSKSLGGWGQMVVLLGSELIGMNVLKEVLGSDAVSQK